MKVESVSVDEISPDPANARTHDRRNLDAIAGSLRKWGQQKPIVISEAGVIVAGNGTWEAAKQIGWKRINAVKTKLEGSEAVAYGIADNRTAELAGWDDAVLGKHLEALQADESIDHLATGFSDDDIKELLVGLNGQDEVVEDEVPEPPAKPVTKAGELIILGDHRLLCGDCRDGKGVSLLMGESQINVAITSPPYAAQREYDEKTSFVPINPAKYVEWFGAVQSNVAKHLAADGSWFINIKEHCEDGQRVLYVKDLTLAHVREWGWRFVDEYIWTHGGTPKAANRRFKNGWEPIFQFAKGPHKFRPDSVMHPTDDVPDWSGLHPNSEEVQRYGTTKGMARQGVDARAKQKGSNAKLQGSSAGGKAIHDAVANSMVTRQGAGLRGGVLTGAAFDNIKSLGLAYPSNVLSLGKNREALGHAAAYPVGLPEFFIKAYSDDADIIYDPFLGSGTTLIAAEQLGRSCYGMEISPAYCDIIVQRWENLTRQKVQREMAMEAVV